MDLAAGLLGGVAGFGNAMDQLGAEQRKKLAEKLKMDAIAEIERKHQERGFKHDETMQGEKIKAEKGMQEKEIGSSGKIAGDRNAMLERIAKMENSMKERSLKQGISATEVQQIKIRQDALEEINKAIANNESLDVINAMASNAGLNLWEEYEEEVPGDSWYSGTKKVKKYRIKGSKTGTGNSKSDLDMLLEEGNALRTAAKPATTRSIAEPEQGPEQQPKPKGILSSAMADSVPSMKTSPQGDPSTWDVRQQGGKFFLITPDGPVEMTPDQISQWRQSQRGM